MSATFQEVNEKYKLRLYTASEISDYDDARLELSESGKIDCTRVYICKDADEVFSKLEKEIERLKIYESKELFLDRKCEIAVLLAESELNTTTMQDNRDYYSVYIEGVDSEMWLVVMEWFKDINQENGQEYYGHRYSIKSIDKEKIKEKLDEGVASKDVLDSLTQGFTENGFEDFKNKLMEVLSSISNEVDMRSK
jgi:hypothetical protein